MRLALLVLSLALASPALAQSSVRPSGATLHVARSKAELPKGVKPPKGVDWKTQMLAWSDDAGPTALQNPNLIRVQHAKDQKAVISGERLPPTVSRCGKGWCVTVETPRDCKCTGVAPHPELMEPVTGQTAFAPVFLLPRLKGELYLVEVSGPPCPPCMVP